MKNKKTLKVLLICITVYMLLSWFIVSGNFSNGDFASSGFNQFGLFDFLVAPFQLFNYFVVTMTKNIDGYVKQIGYGNIVIAFIRIGILYGVLNKTGAYYKMVIDFKKKLKPKKDIFLLIIATIYCTVSALSGLNLILFMFFPFVATILSKLKFNKMTTFTATIGAMLIGQIGSLYNPTINGLNRIMFQAELNSNMVSRLILFLMLLIILLAFLYLNRNKSVKKEEEILLFETDEKSNRSYIPIIITTLVTTIILFVCMYNWYYMFNITSVTEAYNSIMSAEVKGYNFMKNIFGISESFGYWTGFSMSALLLLDSVILSFIYNLKLDKILEGAKKGFIDMLPTIFYSILSLVIIIISLNNGNSFIYSIINNIFKSAADHQIIGVFTSSLLHNFFINDYFALLSSISNPLVTVYGYDSINLSLLITQVSHGLISLITPFNVYLIAGLVYLEIPYTKWIKYIWKTLLIILGVVLIVLLITTKFA